MGLVYLARDAAEEFDAPHELYALKVLRPKHTDPSRALARFLREADIGRLLPPHPHLTRTIDSGDHDGSHYLAMEYVEGRTVTRAVEEDGPLTPGAASRVFADVASGLHQAHSVGVIHRDLKPANVLVSPAGRAKLFDFGFALVRGESSPDDPTILGGQGYVIGTMDYIAPEQTADPVGVGPAADVYALGCSLYFALTGCPPFPGGTPLDKIRWHRSQTAPPAVQVNPSIPAELSALVQHLMAKRPDDRPASAAEVARLLLPWADPVQAVAVTPHDATILRDAEDRWRELRGEGGPDLTDESVTVISETTESPILMEPPLVVGQIRFPHAAVWVVASGLVLALMTAGLLGWVTARLVRG